MRGAGACWIGTLTVVITVSGFAGASWTAVGSGIPSVLSLTLDPRDSDTLYAGTNGGVYEITFREVEQ